MILEIHSSEGGSDSAMFAVDLANAIAKHSGESYEYDGKVIVFHRL